jgi:hypothetical protein
MTGLDPNQAGRSIPHWLQLISLEGLLMPQVSHSHWAAGSAGSTDDLRVILMQIKPMTMTKSNANDRDPIVILFSLLKMAMA